MREHHCWPKKEDSGLSDVRAASEANGPIVEPPGLRAAVQPLLERNSTTVRRITAEARGEPGRSAPTTRRRRLNPTSDQFPERRHGGLGPASIDIHTRGLYVHYNRTANMCSYIEHFENRGVHGRTDDSRETRITEFLKPDDEKEGSV